MADEGFTIEIKADDSGALTVFKRTEDGLERIGKVAKETADKISGAGSASDSAAGAFTKGQASLVAYAAASEIAGLAFAGLKKGLDLATEATKKFLGGIERLDRLEEISTRTGTTVELLSQLDLAS